MGPPSRLPGSLCPPLSSWSQTRTRGMTGCCGLVPRSSGFLARWGLTRMTPGQGGPRPQTWRAGPPRPYRGIPHGARSQPSCLLPPRGAEHSVGERPARHCLALGLGRTSVGPAEVPPTLLVSGFCVSKLRLIPASSGQCLTSHRTPYPPEVPGHLGARESQPPAGLDPTWCLHGREGQGGGQGEGQEATEAQLRGRREKLRKIK